MTDRGYRMSCQADVDPRQYRFERRSGLPMNYFNKRPWYRPSQDAIVFWCVLVVGVTALIWSH